jgi:hypothetical protein
MFSDGMHSALLSEAPPRGSPFAIAVLAPQPPTVLPTVLPIPPKTSVHHDKREPTEQEWREFNALLQALPSLAAAEFGDKGGAEFSSWVTQVAFHAISHQRHAHSDTITKAVARALRESQNYDMLQVKEAGIWRILDIDNKSRTSGDRTYTFGQVPSGTLSSSQFMGGWPIISPSGKLYRVFFVISAESKITRVTPFSEQVHGRNVDGGSEAYYRAILDARGEAPWLLRASPNSKLAEWIARFTGHWRSGMIQDDIVPPLGVISSAALNACEILLNKGPIDYKDFGGSRLSHLLLPPSRREPGYLNWHTGAFFRHGIDAEERDIFTWQGLCYANPALDPAKDPQGAKELVEATIEVKLSAKINGQLKEI